MGRKRTFGIKTITESVGVLGGQKPDNAARRKREQNGIGVAERPRCARGRADAERANGGGGWGPWMKSQASSSQENCQETNGKKRGFKSSRVHPIIGT